MDENDVKHAMNSVMEDMGRAAREGRSRRFTGKRPAKGVKVEIGEVTLEPGNTMKGTGGASADVEVDPVKEAGMTHEEMEELSSQLSIER